MTLTTGYQSAVIPDDEIELNEETVVLPSLDSGEPGDGSTPVAASEPRGRDRYIDSLRAVALVRVVTYHVFGWIWLPVIFPSMGIMFALAGSLVAASLDRLPGNPWKVLLKRLRRLLPPLWLMGLILVPVMIWHGWDRTDEAGDPLHWKTLLLWVLPVSDPPGSAWGSDWVLPLWYIRAYLWFLILSPAFLWLFRHWPKRLIALPLVTLVLASTGVIALYGRSGDIILSLATFGACWMLGFAHHDGTLRRYRWYVVVPVAVCLLASGVAWALTHQTVDTSWNLDNIPLADALYGLGAVLLLLRFCPDFSWMVRRPVLDKTISVINSRAMTIYLWNNVAIFCAPLALGAWSVIAAWHTDSARGWTLQYIASWLIIGVAIVAFGWVEDLAARRRVRLIPWPTKRDLLPAVSASPGHSTQRHVRRLPVPVLSRMALATGTLTITAVAVTGVLLWGTHTDGRGSTAVVPARNEASESASSAASGSQSAQVTASASANAASTTANANPNASGGPNPRGTSTSTTTSSSTSKGSSTASGTSTATPSTTPTTSTSTPSDSDTQTSGSTLGGSMAGQSD